MRVTTKVGVGGLSPRALDETARCSSSALSSLADWQEEARPATFPFRPIVRHYQAVGRGHVDAELVKALRVLAEQGRPRGGRGGRAADGLILSSWLPCTFDQEDGDYDSYGAIRLLHRVAETAAGGPDTGLDLQQVALLADLLAFEAVAAAGQERRSPQEVRLRACLRALARAGELAPGAAGVTARFPPAPAADRAGELALLALDAVPPAVRLAAEITLLPMTPLHDEVMFIRSIQVFELVYRQVARCLERAVAALAGGDAAAATAEVRDAGARVAATGSLYRVLTTMPKESFALIRSSTDGRSAIQSRAYREVERLSAPLPTEQLPMELLRLDERPRPGRSLQEEYLAAGAGPPLDGLAAAMAGLDEAWQAMKRTHWGITLKIIGRVPGTGGSSGADYLREAAERPLFPALSPGGRHA
ncbi:hypothetical protein OIE67_15280 [Nonomuraea fuscirosea]|jgi:tryptophan 2,3-dioxygenase|uniref:hypothetical protein n=1 Tax=Nonomuraea fuscirosea TaxID=1291556 RepID=UPI002DDBAC7F|nr:hypothetical protein [Nonomuraea fuscirosea]WSA55915.1 hypothetical protein OIE67_15280 [Nonomuraea fuscirosea]